MNRDNFIPSRLRVQSIGVGFPAPLTNGDAKVNNITVVGTATVGTVAPVNVNASGTVTASNFVANALANTRAFTFNGQAISPIGVFTSAVAASSYVTFYAAGTAYGDIGSGAATFAGGNAADFGISSRAGRMVLGTGGFERFSINSAGAVTINAPSSSIPLTINGVAGDVPFTNMVTPTARGSGNAYMRIADPTGSKAFIGYPTASDDFYVWNDLATPIYFRQGGAVRLAISAGGNVSVSAPAVGRALEVFGAANEWGMNITGSALSGFSYGLRILAGTTNADFPFVVANRDSANPTFLIYGNGSVSVGQPVGGAKGYGTINAEAGIYENNIRVPHSAFARVNPAGAISVGQGVTFVSITGVSIYTFNIAGFANPPVVTATLDWVSGVFGNVVVIGVTNTQVIVQTFDTAWAPVARGFHLILHGY